MIRYYVETRGNKIVMKGIVPAGSEYAFEDGKIEVSEDFYKTLKLPAIFEQDAEGNIISVTPIPAPPEPPQLPTEEERLEALELAMLDLLS